MQEKAKVLFVEDNDFTRRLLSLIASSLVDAVVVESAAEAVSAADAQRFDAVYVDIALADGDSGVSLMRLLRGHPNLASTPFIACTAFALPGDRDRFLSDGFDDYLGKPFTMPELQSSILKWTDPSADRSEAGGGSRRKGAADPTDRRRRS
jgi:two-component system, cell cycle response regulator DivK